MVKTADEEREMQLKARSGPWIKINYCSQGQEWIQVNMSHVLQQFFVVTIVVILTSKY